MKRCRNLIRAALRAGLGRIAQVRDSLQSYSARRSQKWRGGLGDEEGASDDGSPVFARTPSGSCHASSPSASTRPSGRVVKLRKPQEEVVPDFLGQMNYQR